MKSSELRDSFTFQLHDSHDTSRVELFEFLDAGANRVVYASTTSPIVAKLHPIPKPNGENQNREEYMLYETASGIQDLIPRCHGLVTLDVKGWKYQVLLCDRVAFTLSDNLKTAQSQPVSGRLVTWITRLLLLVVEAMKETAVNREVRCSDWHTANIGFTDTEPPRFVLLDWVGHVVDRKMAAKDKMKVAMTHFVYYLADAPQQWQCVMQTLKTIIKDWFSWLDAAGPSNDDLELLRSRFATACRNAMTAQEQCQISLTSSASAKASLAVSHSTVGLPTEVPTSNPTKTSPAVSHKTVPPTEMPTSSPTVQTMLPTEVPTYPTKLVLPAKRSLSPPSQTPPPSIRDNDIQVWPPTPEADAWTKGLIRQGFVGAAAVRSLSNVVQNLLASWQADGPLHGPRTRSVLAIDSWLYSNPMSLV